MTTILEENTPKRWPRIISILAVLAIVVMLLWRFTLPGNPQDCPGDCPVKPKVTQAEPAQGRAYWWFSPDGQATKFVDRDGNVLVNKNWSEKDRRFPEYKVHSGNLMSANLADGVPATLIAPTKTIKGIASVKVTISTDQVAYLAKAYNALEKELLITHYPEVISPAGLMLSAVLRARLQNGKAAATFVAVNPKTKKNQTVADAYAKGYKPWQLVVGTAEFDYDNEYVWDHACTRYAVELKGEKATLAKMRQVLPFKTEDLSIGRGQSPNDPWEGQVYWANTKTPCGVKVVNQGPTPKPSPTPTPTLPPDRPAPKPDPESLPPKGTDPVERPSDNDTPPPTTSKDPE